jgi:group I intron endonuclease
MTTSDILNIIIKDKYTFEELNSKCGVYILTINNKHYVGSCKFLRKPGSRDGFYYRLYLHLSKLLNKNHHSLKLQNAVNKYGIENITFDILDECPSEFTISIEQYWINILDVFKLGYNSCPTAKSNYGFKWSEESKKKLSDSKKGKSPWNKGIKTNSPSIETRKKLSDSLVGRKKGPMSEKQKQQIRETLILRNKNIKENKLVYANK